MADRVGEAGERGEAQTALVEAASIAADLGVTPSSELARRIDDLREALDHVPGS